MTSPETDLLNHLRALEELVPRLPHLNPKPDLKALFDQIEAATQRLPAGTHPQLLHFLSRKSYQKARQWLEGAPTAPEPNRPRCS